MYHRMLSCVLIAGLGDVWPAAPSLFPDRSEQTAPSLLVDRSEQIGMLQSLHRGHLVMNAVETQDELIKEAEENRASDRGGRRRRRRPSRGSSPSPRPPPSSSKKSCQSLAVTYGGHNNHVSVKPGVKELFSLKPAFFREQCSAGIMDCIEGKDTWDCSKDTIGEMLEKCGQRWCCSDGMSGYTQKLTKKCKNMFRLSVSQQMPMSKYDANCELEEVVEDFCEILEYLPQSLIEFQNDEHQITHGHKNGTDLFELKLKAGHNHEDDQEPKGDEARASSLAQVLQQRSLASSESMGMSLEESLPDKCV